MMRFLSVCLLAGTVASSLQAQHVGIGTTNPLARLHVTDSSVVFSASGGAVSGTSINPPAIGPGRRLMWYAAKAAFRSGFVATSFWDRDSTGIYSMASGINPLALGDYSLSVGSFTRARGNGSVAIGNNTIAARDNAVAIGDGAEANGLWSIALGLLTRANGTSSFAAGRQTLASGNSSIAMGENTIASQAGSVALGIGTRATIPYSLVAGQYNDTTAVANAGKLFQVGNGSADNNRSNAITVLSDGRTGIATDKPVALLHQDKGNGISTYHKFTAGSVTGQSLFDGLDIGIDAEGNAELWQHENKAIQLYTNNTVALKIDSAGNTGIGTAAPAAKLHVNTGSVVFEEAGDIPLSPGAAPVNGSGRRLLWYADKAAFRSGYVTATKWDQLNTGNYSFAAGNNTMASANSAAAFGDATAATGFAAFAAGSASSADGNQSFASGLSVAANGASAAALGEYTVANGFAALVTGRFNDSIVAPQSVMANNTPLFIVGNGLNHTTRSNAFIVRNDANTGINTSNPRTNLDINGDISYRQNTLVLVNGVNDNADAGKYSFVTVAGPTASFTITGLINGRDGKIITILNTTGFDMTIANLGNTSAGINRINTLTGADFVTTGNGSVTLQYSAADSRWMVIARQE